jgi:hypothetical protein
MKGGLDMNALYTELDKRNARIFELESRMKTIIRIIAADFDREQSPLTLAILKVAADSLEVTP